MTLFIQLLKFSS